ncbi:unnamed protein product [Amoebophrya sp. A25]|nr:unnamed protein product [Amoebophrya sp. A25]|eukprot:GSA25T00020664001.1
MSDIDSTEQSFYKRSRLPPAEFYVEENPRDFLETASLKRARIAPVPPEEEDFSEAVDADTDTEKHPDAVQQLEDVVKTNSSQPQVQVSLSQQVFLFAPGEEQEQPSSPTSRKSTSPASSSSSGNYAAFLPAVLAQKCGSKELQKYGYTGWKQKTIDAEILNKAKPDDPDKANMHGKRILYDMFGLELSWSTFPRVKVKQLKKGGRAANSGVVAGDYLATINEVYKVTDIAKWAKAEREKPDFNPKTTSPAEDAIVSKMKEKLAEKQDTTGEKTSWGFVFHRAKYAKGYLQIKMPKDLLAKVRKSAKGFSDNAALQRFLGLKMGDAAPADSDETAKQHNRVFEVLADEVDDSGKVTKKHSDKWATAYAKLHAGDEIVVISRSHLAPKPADEAHGFNGLLKRGFTESNYGNVDLLVRRTAGDGFANDERYTKMDTGPGYVVDIRRIWMKVDEKGVVGTSAERTGTKEEIADKMKGEYYKKAEDKIASDSKTKKEQEKDNELKKRLAQKQEEQLHKQKEEINTLKRKSSLLSEHRTSSKDHEDPDGEEGQDNEQDEAGAKNPLKQVPQRASPYTMDVVEQGSSSTTTNTVPKEVLHALEDKLLARERDLNARSRSLSPEVQKTAVDLMSPSERAAQAQQHRYVQANAGAAADVSDMTDFLNRQAMQETSNFAHLQPIAENLDVEMDPGDSFPAMVTVPLSSRYATLEAGFNGDPDSNFLPPSDILKPERSTSTQAPPPEALYVSLYLKTLDDRAGIFGRLDQQEKQGLNKLAGGPRMQLEAPWQKYDAGKASEKLSALKKRYSRVCESRNALIRFQELIKRTAPGGRSSNSNIVPALSARQRALVMGSYDRDTAQWKAPADVGRIGVPDAEDLRGDHDGASQKENFRGDGTTSAKDVGPPSGPIMPTRQVPPREDALLLKDGLDMTFMHLRSQAERLTTVAEEVTRKITQSLNDATAQQLLDANFITNSEKDVLQEQESMRIEHGRMKDELREAYQDEEQARFFVERHARQSFYDQMFGRGGTTAQKQQQEEAFSSSGPSELDPEDVIVVPLDAETRELKIPPKEKPPKWQRMLDGGVEPDAAPVVLNPSALREAIEDIREEVRQEQQTTVENAREFYGMLNKTSTSSSAPQAQQQPLGPQVDIDIHALENVVNLFQVRLGDVIVRLQICSDDCGDPSAWGHALKGDSLTYAQRACIVDTKHFSTIRLSSLHSNVVPFHRRLFFGLGEGGSNSYSGSTSKTVDANATVWLHLTFYEALQEVDREFLRNTDKASRNKGKDFDVEDPLAQACIRLHNGEPSGKLHALQPIYSTKEKKLLQAFGHDACLRARGVLRDPPPLSGSPGFSDDAAAGNGGMFMQDQSWNASNAADQVSNKAIGERWRQWEQSGLEEIPASENILARAAAAEKRGGLNDDDSEQLLNKATSDFFAFQKHQDDTRIATYRRIDAHMDEKAATAKRLREREAEKQARAKRKAEKLQARNRDFTERGDGPDHGEAGIEEKGGGDFGADSFKRKLRMMEKARRKQEKMNKKDVPAAGTTGGPVSAMQEQGVHGQEGTNAGYDPHRDGGHDPPSILAKMFFNFNAAPLPKMQPDEVEDRPVDVDGDGEPISSDEDDSEELEDDESDEDDGEEGDDGTSTTGEPGDGTSSKPSTRTHARAERTDENIKHRHPSTTEETAEPSEKGMTTIELAKTMLESKSKRAEFEMEVRNMRDEVRIRAVMRKVAAEEMMRVRLLRASPASAAFGSNSRTSQNGPDTLHADEKVELRKRVKAAGQNELRRLKNERGQHGELPVTEQELLDQAIRHAEPVMREAQRRATDAQGSFLHHGADAVRTAMMDANNVVVPLEQVLEVMVEYEEHAKEMKAKGIEERDLFHDENGMLRNIDHLRQDVIGGGSSSSLKNNDVLGLGRGKGRRGPHAHRDHSAGIASEEGPPDENAPRRPVSDAHVVVSPEVREAARKRRVQIDEQTEQEDNKGFLGNFGQGIFFYPENEEDDDHEHRRGGGGHTSTSATSRTTSSSATAEQSHDCSSKAKPKKRTFKICTSGWWGCSAGEDSDDDANNGANRNRGLKNSHYDSTTSAQLRHRQLQQRLGPSFLDGREWNGTMDDLDDIMRQTRNLRVDVPAPDVDILDLLENGEVPSAEMLAQCAQHAHNEHMEEMETRQKRYGAHFQGYYLKEAKKQYLVEAQIDHEDYYEELERRASIVSSDEGQEQEGGGKEVDLPSSRYTTTSTANNNEDDGRYTRYVDGSSTTVDDINYRGTERNFRRIVPGMVIEDARIRDTRDDEGEGTIAPDDVGAGYGGFFPTNFFGFGVGGKAKDDEQPRTSKKSTAASSTSNFFGFGKNLVPSTDFGGTIGADVANANAILGGIFGQNGQRQVNFADDVVEISPASSSRSPGSSPDDVASRLKRELQRKIVSPHDIAKPDMSLLGADSLSFGGSQTANEVLRRRKAAEHAQTAYEEFRANKAKEKKTRLDAEKAKVHAERSEVAEGHIREASALRLPPKLQWVGIPTPNVLPITPDKAACLIEDFDLELFPDYEDALDFHNVLTELRSADNVFQLLQFKKFRRFRYSLTDLYSKLFTLQHDGYLARGPAARQQEHAQLVLEYALAVAREPRLPFGNLVSQIAALLIDCLRKFPCNPFLHFWGLEALLNIVRQQKQMDKLAVMERDAMELKAERRQLQAMTSATGAMTVTHVANVGTKYEKVKSTAPMVETALSILPPEVRTDEEDADAVAATDKNPNRMRDYLAAFLCRSEYPEALGVITWDSMQLEKAVVRNKDTTARQKVRDLFGFVLDWRDFPRVRVQSVEDEKPIVFKTTQEDEDYAAKHKTKSGAEKAAVAARAELEEDAPRSAAKAAGVGEGDILLRICGEKVSSMIDWPGDNPDEALLARCVQCVANKKPYSFHLLKRKNEAEYLQLEAHRPDLGFNVELGPRGFLVTRVTERTGWAARNGVRLGDMLVVLGSTLLEPLGIVDWGSLEHEVEIELSLSRGRRPLSLLFRRPILKAATSEDEGLEDGDKEDKKQDAVGGYPDAVRNANEPDLSPAIIPIRWRHADEHYASIVTRGSLADRIFSMSSALGGSSVKKGVDDKDDKKKSSSSSKDKKEDKDKKDDNDRKEKKSKDDDKKDKKDKKEKKEEKEPKADGVQWSNMLFYPEKKGKPPGGATGKPPGSKAKAKGTGKGPKGGKTLRGGKGGKTPKGGLRPPGAGSPPGARGMVGGKPSSLSSPRGAAAPSTQLLNIPSSTGRQGGPPSSGKPAGGIASVAAALSASAAPSNSKSAIGATAIGATGVGATAIDQNNDKGNREERKKARQMREKAERNAKLDVGNLLEGTNKDLNEDAVPFLPSTLAKVKHENPKELGLTGFNIDIKDFGTGDCLRDPSLTASEKLVHYFGLEFSWAEFPRVRVTKVEKYSPRRTHKRKAFSRGVQEGDLLVVFSGHPISNVAEWPTTPKLQDTDAARRPPALLSHAGKMLGVAGARSLDSANDPNEALIQKFISNVNARKKPAGNFMFLKALYQQQYVQFEVKAKAGMDLGFVLSPPAEIDIFDEPPPKSRKPEEVDEATKAAREGSFFVTAVQELVHPSLRVASNSANKTWAYKSGIQIGDRLVAAYDIEGDETIISSVNAKKMLQLTGIYGRRPCHLFFRRGCKGAPKPKKVKQPGDSDSMSGASSEEEIPLDQRGFPFLIQQHCWKAVKDQLAKLPTAWLLRGAVLADATAEAELLKQHGDHYKELLDIQDQTFLTGRGAPGLLSVYKGRDTLRKNNFGHDPLHVGPQAQVKRTKQVVQDRLWQDVEDLEDFEELIAKHKDDPEKVAELKREAEIRRERIRVMRAELRSGDGEQGGILVEHRAKENLSWMEAERMKDPNYKRQKEQDAAKAKEKPTKISSSFKPKHPLEDLSSVPVPHHRQQFQIVVFQYLSIGMRIQEEVLQWRILDALAETIHPDCIITHEHIDFALDLLQGKERIARRLEQEDRQAATAVKSVVAETRKAWGRGGGGSKDSTSMLLDEAGDDVVSLMDEVVGSSRNTEAEAKDEEDAAKQRAKREREAKKRGIDADLIEMGPAELRVINRKREREDELFWRKYKAVMMHRDSQADAISLGKSPEYSISLRQERQRFLTVQSYEVFFSILLSAKTAHRLLEQHAFCLRALLRYKAAPRMLTRALLVLGNLYELALVVLEKEQDNVLLLRPLQMHGVSMEQRTLDGAPVHASAIEPEWRSEDQRIALQLLKRAADENVLLLGTGDVLLDEGSTSWVKKGFQQLFGSNQVEALSSTDRTRKGLGVGGIDPVMWMDDPAGTGDGLFDLTSVNFEGGGVEKFAAEARQRAKEQEEARLRAARPGGGSFLEGIGSFFSGVINRVGGAGVGRGSSSTGGGGASDEVALSGDNLRKAKLLKEITTTNLPSSKKVNNPPTAVREHQLDAPQIGGRITFADQIRVQRNQHRKIASLMDLMCQILDLTPDNRKVAGAALRVMALLCFLSKSQVVHVATSSVNTGGGGGALGGGGAAAASTSSKVATAAGATTSSPTSNYIGFGACLRSVHFAVKRHPDSQSVLKHALQIYHAVAMHDLRLGTSLGDVLRTLITMGGLLKDDLEAKHYLVNTIRILAEGAENVTEFERPLGLSFLNMLDAYFAGPTGHLKSAYVLDSTMGEKCGLGLAGGGKDNNNVEEQKQDAGDKNNQSNPSSASTIEQLLIPLLEALTLFSHENAKLRAVLLPGLKYPVRLLNEDRLPLSVQAKAANCIKVLAMAANDEQLQHPLMHVLAENNGLAVILKSGKKYVSASTPMCLEYLSALANLFHCTTIRDTIFGKEYKEQSEAFVEWVITLMEENGIADVDVVAQGFRLFGSLTRYEDNEKLEDEVIEMFVLSPSNMARLRLLVNNCLLLRNIGVPPFQFLEDLARQQLAGRPLAGRILSPEGHVLLEEEFEKEDFWL